MLAAILFSLTAYGLYQPSILTELGFAEWATGLSIAQGLMGAVLEPVVGGQSDRILRRFGSRLPQITIGVAIAGLLFVVISLLLGDLPVGIRWLIPVLMTAWVMAMIVFRGPVVALLMQFAPLAELPQANAVLVLVLGLMGAIAPLLRIALMQLGTSPTFVLGAIVLLLGAFTLYNTAPLQAASPSYANASSQLTRVARIGVLTFLVGLGASLQASFLFAVFPPILSTYLPGISGEAIGSILLVICALSANPIGRFTVKIGAIGAMQIGLGAIALLIGLVLFNQNTLLTVLLIFELGVALGLVFISTIPYALSVMPPHQAGLSTGLYFGGSGAAVTLGTIFMQSIEVTPLIASLGVIGGGLIAILCLAASRPWLDS